MVLVIDCQLSQGNVLTAKDRNSKTARAKESDAFIPLSLLPETNLSLIADIATKRARRSRVPGAN